MPTKVQIPYEPRAAFLPFHNRGKRWACLVCHRRGGKTVACINELIKAAITFTKHRDGRFAYVAPQLTQAKDVAWGYLKHYSSAIPGMQYNESELRADFPNGARVRLYGSDNAERLRGLYLDGVVMDEYANHDPTVFDKIIRPMLSDREGWAVFIGTPAGHNAFHELYQKSIGAWQDEQGVNFDNRDWFSMLLKASKSGLIAAPELAALKRDMTEDAFEQEYECSFEAAIVGAVFGKEMKRAEEDGRITKVPYDPGCEVWTAWDLGNGPNMAIWFAQQVGREVRIIDFLLGPSTEIVGLDWYVKQLKDKPYTYGRHILPHDADKTELGTGMSIREQLKQLGVRNTVVCKKLALHEGLNRTKMFIPRCYFDRKKCYQGVEALKLFRFGYDDKAGVATKKPVHDWTSHPSDAFRYLACAFKPEALNAERIVYPNLGIP